MKGEYIVSVGFHKTHKESFRFVVIIKCISFDLSEMQFLFSPLLADISNIVIMYRLDGNIA